MGNGVERLPGLREFVLQYSLRLDELKEKRINETLATANGVKTVQVFYIGLLWFVY